MNATKCVCCYRYWIHCTGSQHFGIITRVCPACIAKVLPLYAPPPRKDTAHR